MPAAVIEDMQLGRIEIAAVGAVAQEGTLLPAVPEPVDDIGELFGPRVTIRMRDESVMIEVQRGRGIGRGHEIPAGAPAAQPIERGELPGHVERLVVTGRHRRDETDPRRHRRQR